jgi:hypothetical protein
MPAAVVDELAVQPPQEPENVADDHREQIINNLSDEDIPLPAAPQISGQNTPKPSTSSASERKMSYKTSKLQRQRNPNQRLL